MKTYRTYHYDWQPESCAALASIPEGTVARQAHQTGINGNEPLIVIADSLVRYTKAYRKAFGGNLAEDGILGAPVLTIAREVLVLLNGDGAVAYERGITTDSKDNGAVQDMLYAALRAGGWKDSELNR